VPKEGRDPVRVLLMTQFFPPVIGGVEVHVQALARGLAARGNDVAVVTQAAGDLPPFERRDDVDIYRLHGALQRIGPLFTADRRHAPPFPDPEMVLRLRRVMASVRPQIVHAHNWLGRSFVPLKRRSGARYVLSLHDCSSACTQFRMMYRDVEPCDSASLGRCLSCCAHHYGAVKGGITLASNMAMRRAEAAAVDLFLPVSSAIAEANRLAELGVPYEIVPNFSRDAEDAAEPAACDLGDLPAGPFILQVGDVVADKGAHVLLEAYATMRDAPPLVFIGHVRTELPDPLPRGVSVLGPRPHAFVTAAWRRALFGTIPSLCLDASPTVTLEAMAAGKPVVASAIGGLTDQVDDEVTGLLVPPGDAALLGTALSTLAGDAPMRERMGAAGRLRFEEHFSSQVVIARIEDLYRSLLPEGRAGKREADGRSAEGM
jgi:glycosyltransferase involved in cell wall biosynthesis